MLFLLHAFLMEYDTAGAYQLIRGEVGDDFLNGVEKQMQTAGVGNEL